ncbi:MAG: hypothetical protein AAF821_21175 [Cyanobacteria bacterium P01_D01_bin.156]
MATVRLLPAPPPGSLPSSRVLPPLNASKPNAPSQDSSIGVQFPSPNAIASLQKYPAAVKAVRAIPSWLYEGGADSLVARVIGSAEGTRAATGQPTRAYYGHTDPGNGVWNLGTFSYQHGARSPEEADKKQLKRLKQQGKTLANQADQAALDMTLGEILNGLDLANQAPRAALDRGGYIDRLVQARQQGMENGDAIVWARTYSYMEPSTQRWNAPGLGNTLSGIMRDQQRRHDAVSRSFEYYKADMPPSSAPTKQDLSLERPAIAHDPMTTPVVTSNLKDRKPSNMRGIQPNSLDSVAAVSSTQRLSSTPTRQELGGLSFDNDLDIQAVSTTVIPGRESLSQTQLAPSQPSNQT